MKPVSLEISGLHSFREKQFIDFRALCEGGVFGIFGPTGSGKSSILDAITLALFGCVERAPNNTHGIINHAEDKLSVSFTFELENAEGRKRYIIERSFKRSEEWRLKSSTSRLIEASEELLVLADKTSEVNKKVEELLGLEMKDFTRAVVLPQGKFAEFLSLKGVERRQMLQRLFHLEQYGDKLNKKLKQRIAKSSAELNEIIAEQNGLGDASKKAIERAENEWKECQLLLTKRQAELAEIEKQYEQQKQLWSWQIEKEAIERELEKLRKEEEKIKRMEEKKKRAEQAEQLRPYLEQYTAIGNTVRLSQTKLLDLEKRLGEAQENYTKAVRGYEQARQKKAELEPELLSKKEQLSHALQLIQEAKQMKNEVASLQKQLMDLTENEQVKQDELNKVEQLYNRGSEKQKTLKQELQQYAISFREKENIYRAYEEKQKLLADYRGVQETRENLAKKQQILQQVKEKEKKNELRSVTLKEKIDSIFAYIQQTYHQVCEQEVHLTKFLYKKEQLLQSEKTNQLALLLAQALYEGEPCPVCGSIEHPNPHKHKIGEHADGEAVKQLEHTLKIGQANLQTLQKLKMQLEQLSQTVTEERNNEIKLQEIKLIQSEIQGKENLAEIEVEVKSLQQDYLERKEEAQKTIHELRAAEKERAEAGNQLKLLQTDVEELERQLAERNEQYSRLQKKWHEIYNEFAFDSVEQLREQVREKEVKAQDLQKRLEVSVQFLEEKLKERDKLREERQVLEREKVHIASLLRTKQELLCEYKKKLKELTGDNEVNELIIQLERELTSLKATEEKAYKTWQAAQEAYQMLESETKAARRSLEEGQKQYEEATSRWTKQLALTVFANEDEVRESFIPEEELKRLSEQLEGYWEHVKKLNIELERVTKALNGNKVTSEQWHNIQVVREHARQSVNETIQMVGAVQKTVEELRKKHKRFEELEEKRKELTKLLERYHQLQTVLKGNSFVEYIAEEQLMQITHLASERLGALTRQRYAIEVDSQGGFIIRDDANGGIRRPATTLSGGETFLTSLSLALALSAQIQLRGEYPLQFFFLDEGFGTLDTELLDTVITALEKLHSHQLSIGVISHVQELQARLPKRLIVEPPEPSGRGTRVRLEVM